MKSTDRNPRADETNSGKVFWKRVDFWVVLLLLAAASAFYKDSLHEIREGLRQVTGREVLNSVLFSLAAYFLEGMTIACMVSTVRPVFPVGRGTVIAYLCEFYRLITLGSGAGVAEICCLHRDGIETGTATVLTMLQYVCKRTAVLVLGGFGVVALCFGQRMPEACRELIGEYAFFLAAGCVISVGVIAAFLCVTLNNKISSAMLTLLDWMSGKFPALDKKWHAWKEQVILLNRSGRSVLGQKRKISCAILLQIGKLLLFYGIPAYLLHNGIFNSICVMAVVYMLSGIIPAPSGAGSLEFVFLLFFSRFVEAQAAIPAVLVFRFATWIVPFAIGGLLYSLLKMQAGS